jgi:hypothetical protein
MARAGMGRAGGAGRGRRIFAEVKEETEVKEEILGIGRLGAVEIRDEEERVWRLPAGLEGSQAGQLRCAPVLGPGRAMGPMSSQPGAVAPGMGGISMKSGGLKARFIRTGGDESGQWPGLG